MHKIPFNRPFIVGKELYYIAQAVTKGQIAGNGIFTKKCHNLIEKRFSAKQVLLTHSCTAALEMASILCDIQAGDEVIIPSFTFVSTANAFYMRGAKLVFADIRPDTLNIDEQKIEQLITSKTKVIVPVHYGGIACEMDIIMNIAHQHNLLVVEDAAQGVCSTHKGKYLGTIGDLGTFSFHETKNFISGEGGALLINNEAFCERAEIIWEKGTNRSQFFRGEVDKYSWVDVGSSYLPSDIIAAFLYAQLENMENINNRRQQIFSYYYQALEPLQEHIQLPYCAEYCQCNYHLFYVLLENEQVRDELIAYLKKHSVLAVFHFLPLHLSKIGRSIGYDEGDFPISESISGRLLRLPFYYELSKKQQDIVINHVYDFFKI